MNHDACVHTLDVSLSTVRGGKSKSAVGTRVRTLPGVRQLVSLQRVLFLELAQTGVARETRRRLRRRGRQSGGVEVGPPVLHQHLHGVEGISTGSTDQTRLSCVQLLVGDLVIELGEASPAPPARVRGLSGVLAQVFGEPVPAREVRTADVTRVRVHVRQYVLLIHTGTRIVAQVAREPVQAHVLAAVDPAREHRAALGARILEYARVF